MKPIKGKPGYFEIDSLGSGLPTPSDVLPKVSEICRNLRMVAPEEQLLTMFIQLLADCGGWYGINWANLADEAARNTIDPRPLRWAIRSVVDCGLLKIRYTSCWQQWFGEEPFCWVICSTEKLATIARE